MDYKRYLLVLLTIILVFNHVDRLAMGLLLEDIKVDLNISDTQLGLLTGIAFALFYAVMGIPIARWADRGNRVTIISLTAALWSVAVAVCGAAASFLQLMLIRVVVAVGEAGCHPPALSLLADYFTRAERPRAISRYLLGWPLALVTGYAAAGWLNEAFGWRATFVVLGLPGLVLAALAALTLRDPRYLGAVRSVTPSLESSLTQPECLPSFREILRTLWASAAYRNLLFCLALVSFFTHGIMQWQPAFFVRSHGLGTGELGMWLALVYGVGGILGTYIGGELAAHYAANNERRQLVAIAATFVIFSGVTAGVYIARDHRVAFALLGISAIGGGATNGPLFAATQALVPPRMRAMSIAIVLFVSHLVGMGFGPLVAGALSDALRPFFGQESLRYALLALAPGYLWGAWHAWRGSQTVERDVASAEDAALVSGAR